MVSWKKLICIDVRALGAAWIVLLPLTVLAAPNEISEQFRKHSVETYLWYGGLVALGSLGGMLFRLKNAYMTDGKVAYPLLFISSDLIGGFLAGVACGFAAYGNNFPDWGIIGTGILSSFGGSFLLDKAWKAISDKILKVAPDTKLGELVKKATGVPVPSDERAGPISKRGMAPTGEGNAGKYD